MEKYTIYSSHCNRVFTVFNEPNLYIDIKVISATRKRVLDFFFFREIN